MPRQQGRKKGSGTVELRKRINELPIVLEDLKCHLAFYDFLSQPLLDEDVEDEIRSKINKFNRQLEKMIMMEAFITLFKIKVKQPHLFEKNRDLEEDPTAIYRRSQLEQFFIEFNDLLEDGEPRYFLPRWVQFGADLELMLQLMERFFRIPGCSAKELLNRGVPTASSQKNRSWSHIRSIESVLKELSPKKADIRDGFSQYDKRKITPQYKQKRFYFSVRLRESLKQEVHRDQVRVINANARDRHQRACNYIGSLFTKYRDLTFVAMDLCFDSKSSLLDRSDQLKEFKKKAQKGEHFPPMIGHIGKWEHTLIKGTYVRIICIFEKQEKPVAALLPVAIGSYWMDYITHGAGHYHQAKLAPEFAVSFNSICTISITDSSARKQFERRVILYLTLSQEYYRFKFNRNFAQDMKVYRRELEEKREKELQLVSEESPEKKVRQVPRKSSGRYTALPVSDEPHDIFFRGEVVVKSKSKDKKSASMQGQEVFNLEIKTDLDVRENDVVAAVTESSAEMSVDTSSKKIHAIAVPVKQNRRYITVKANSREK